MIMSNIMPMMPTMSATSRRVNARTGMAQRVVPRTGSEAFERNI